MKPAQIVAALKLLEATRATSENKEWLASRKEIGRRIDPEAVDVTWEFAPVLDPYVLCGHLSDNLDLIGREYFARSSDQEDWVSFDDLPPRTRDRLWQRMRAGHFDARDVKQAAAGDFPVDLSRMLFQPKRSSLVSWGRTSPRTSRRADSPLIVKPADPESMIYGLVIFRGPCIGWMPAQTAKRLHPLITVGSIAAHFVGQHELRAMGDLETFLRQSA